MYHKMSLVLRYEFNDLATFTTDATGNGYTLTDVNSVGSTTDTTYGTVASFTASSNNYFVLPTAPSEITGSATRTFSYWMKIKQHKLVLSTGREL